VSDAAELHERMVNETVRNNLFDWLQRASTVQAQVTYQRDIEFAWVPGDLIFSTTEWDLADPSIREALKATCSAEELAALALLQETAMAAWEAIREARPSIENVQDIPEWVRFRELAATIELVFEKRGPSIEARDYWKNS
jgi:hypothetical protein